MVRFFCLFFFFYEKIRGDTRHTVNVMQYMAGKEILVSGLVGKLETLFAGLLVGLFSLNKNW